MSAQSDISKVFLETWRYLVKYDNNEAYGDIW